MATMTDKLIPTPSQTVGPFFHLGMTRPEWADLTVGNPARRAHRDRGPGARRRRRAGAGRGASRCGRRTPPGATTIPDDSRDDAPLDPGFRGFGRVATGADGEFRLVTIKPGPVPGRGNAWQAPHINVALFARGLLRHLYTRIYFADDPRNEADPLLSSIDDEAVRGTLLARQGGGGEPPVYRFDIVLQGENETAFLDI